MKILSLDRIGNVEIVITTIDHLTEGKIIVKDYVETRGTGRKVIIDSQYLDVNGYAIQDWKLIEEIDVFLSKENVVDIACEPTVVNK